MASRVALSVALFVILTTCLASNLQKNEGLYVNEWAVKVTGGERVAREVAEDNGFEFDGQVGTLPGTYAFTRKRIRSRSKRASVTYQTLLERDDRVTWAEQQSVIYHAEKSAEILPPDETGDDWAIPFNDPLWEQQWYLYNDGQSGATPGMDMNLMPAWKLGYTGKGVVVSIVDDGMDEHHPDLRDNFDKYASFDFNDRRKGNSPTPDYSKPAAEVRHGTRCAGEVAAAANNSICGVGVAYEASIGGVRLLDGTITDRLTAEAIQYNNSHVDIYSCCWGPVDDGKRFEMPRRLTREAFAEGARSGRNGKGSIFVWAAGNGGDNQDHCGADGYVGDIHTIAISSINDEGRQSYFDESCAAIMAVTLSGGPQALSEVTSHQFRWNLVSTTDLNGTCTSSFVGTSSAAPLASGVFAVILQSNPELTWRDLQYIISEGCKIPTPYDQGWIINGAGLHVHHNFGFGVLDAGKMVELALTWDNVGPQRVWERDPIYPDITVYQGEAMNVTFDVSCSEISQLEHVVLTVSFQARRRGDVSIDLISPAGTPSRLLGTRRYDSSEEGLNSWDFMTVHNWGEDPNGVWLVQFSYNSSLTNVQAPEDEVLELIPRLHRNSATLTAVGMTLYGLEEARSVAEGSEDDGGTQQQHDGNEIQEENPAVNPEDAGRGDQQTIVKIYNQEQLDSEEINIEPEDIAPGLPAPPNMAHNLNKVTGDIATGNFDGHLVNPYDGALVKLAGFAKRMDASDPMLAFLASLDDRSLDMLERDFYLDDGESDVMKEVRKEDAAPALVAKEEVKENVMEAKELKVLEMEEKEGDLLSLLGRRLQETEKSADTSDHSLDMHDRYVNLINVIEAMRQEYTAVKKEEEEEEEQFEKKGQNERVGIDEQNAKWEDLSVPGAREDLSVTGAQEKNVRKGSQLPVNRGDDLSSTDLKNVLRSLEVETLRSLIVAVEARNNARTDDSVKTEEKEEVEYHQKKNANEEALHHDKKGHDVSTEDLMNVLPSLKEDTLRSLVSILEARNNAGKDEIRGRGR